MKIGEQHKKTKGGFTLIETFVAITILLLAVAGPMTLASRSLASASFSKDQIIAFYLAQEAIEYIRHTRDSNQLATAWGTPTDWLSGLDGVGGTPNCFSPNKCKIDVQATAGSDISICNNPPGNNCPPLLYNTVTHFYTYETGNPTPFTREVTLERIPGTIPGPNDEVKINVTIRWKSGFLPERTFLMKENIYNWLP